MAKRAEGNLVQWYTASFLIHRQIKRAEVLPSQEYWYLLSAEDNDVAYAKALGLATNMVRELIIKPGEPWILDGLSDLLIVADDPMVPDGELVWTEQELRPDELKRYVRAKEQLRVFRDDPARSHNTGWYVCKLVLVEVHDTGAHGDSSLVWTNTHLIRASNRDGAYSHAISLGNEHASESGTHRCDGDTAHWEFKGLLDLIQTIDPPHDGARLWFEGSDLSREQLMKRIPAKAELGAFELEARRRSGEVQLKL